MEDSGKADRLLARREHRLDETFRSLQRNDYPAGRDLATRAVPRKGM